MEFFARGLSSTYEADNVQAQAVQGTGDLHPLLKAQGPCADTFPQGNIGNLDIFHGETTPFLMWPPDSLSGE